MSPTPSPNESVYRDPEGGKINLIDVGSAGRLPPPWDKHPEYIDTVLKFEPRDDKEASDRTISINTALWSAEGERDFYVYKGFNGTGSSLFRQNYRFVRENFAQLKHRGPRRFADTWVDRSELVRIERIFCRTLDAVLGELHPCPKFGFLKIDAQGAEYEILQGAMDYLRRDCQGLFLEIFTIPLYEGIPLAPEMESFLGQLGFNLAFKAPAHGSFDSQHDCLFLKRGADPSFLDIMKRVYKLDQPPAPTAPRPPAPPEEPPSCERDLRELQMLHRAALFEIRNREDEIRVLREQLSSLRPA